MSSFESFVTFIYVADLSRSAAFYEQTLGLALWLDQGSCRIYQVSPHAMIGICQADQNSKGQPPDSGTNTILTLVTSDVDAAYKEIIVSGFMPQSQPTLNHKYNIYHFFLRDPDGYLIEIQKFLTIPHD